MAYAKLKQTNPRVAIYVRVSTLHQVDKDSLPMQKQDLLAYAKLMLGTALSSRMQGTPARTLTVRSSRK